MKEKLKVYHGLPKTPTNENTLFYASFDGSLRPEIHHGQMTKQGVERSFSAGITGYCLRETNNSSELSYEFPEYATNNLPEVSTVDLWAYYPGYQGKVMRFIYAMFCDILVMEDSYLYVGFWRNRVRVKQLDVGYYHFRLILKPLNKTTGETSVDLYINGKKEGTYITTISDNENPLATVSVGHRSDSYACAVSDVHVTLEDLGDYFPTLPQDYIDGKAIVVPALNQRQSYGDPVLHQVTELLVKSQPTEVLGTIYDLNDRDADGLERCFTNPELRTANAHNWEASFGKIRITGLGNTVITGVFDTDTAKCRIIKPFSSGNNFRVYVDTVSGINVGDTLQYVNPDMTTQSNYVYTVQEVDSVNKVLTTNVATSWEIGAYFFETTTSSSSPVVKTVDGTTVNGTWSGLGTRVATFTFGDNSNIVGKDLVVTYCLNAVGNSSPYPKMPSEVIRGYNELGHELIPANGIVIQDDFKGKISGSILECPHTLKYALESSLRLPNDHWNEFTQSHYNTVASIASPVQGHIAQILVEVDLVRFVENKMGVEIPGNKLNWLNNNIKNITCKALVRGNNDTNNNCYIKYMGNGNSWILNSSGATSNSSSAKLIVASWSPTGLLSSTKSYFLIHSDALSVAGNDNLKSRVVLSDVQLELTFNIDERYDYLYTKDLASRCDGYANPILVDKQTKEVKRLLPSTAPFSTEVLLHSPTKQDKYFEDLGILYDPSHTYITTHGTGTSCPTYDVFRGLVAKLDMSALFPHKLLNENLFNSPVTNASYRSSKIKRVLSQPYPSNFNFDSVEDAYEVDSVYLSPRIVQYGKEVYLYVLAYQLDCTNYRDNSANTQVIYKLPNRPLIK